MGIGRAPRVGTGKGLQDADWLLGLAGGDNLICQDVTCLAGGGQPGAPVMGGVVNGVEATLIRLKVVTSVNDSSQLPQAIHGREISVLNGTANSANIYANSNVNKATGALDTVNGAVNTQAVAVAGNATAYFFCPADGVWGQK